jgi:hypothetical protein
LSRDCKRKANRSARTPDQAVAVVTPAPDTRSVEPTPGPVRTSTADSTLTVLVNGPLDGTTAAALLEAVRTGVGPGIERLEVDLRNVDDFTDDGAGSLTEVRDLGRGLARGVHYRTTVGAGRDAFLVAFASPDDEV